MSKDNGAKNSKQKSTMAKLSAKRRKILEIICNPEHANKSITEICSLAGTTRNTYYNCMEDEAFVEHLEYERERLLKSAVNPMIKVFVSEGMKGSFNHGQTILKMAGAYIEVTKQQIEAQVKSEVKAEIEADVRSKIEQELNIYGDVVNHHVEYDLKNLTDEELENLEKLERKLNPTEPSTDT